MAGTKGLHAMDHAHQVDAEQPLPVVRIGQGVAAGVDRGIVHHHRDRAEALGDLGGQRRHRRAIRHIGRNGQRLRADGRGLRFEPRLVPIGHADLKAHAGEPARRRKADPARRPGDHRGISGPKRVVLIRHAAGALCS
jgi:hypothetical protein